MRHRQLNLLGAVATLLLLASAATSAEYRFETVAGNLEHPWSLAFLPDGRMLVTERAGRLRVVADGVLQEEAVTGLPQAYVAGQGGLLDVLPAPEFDSTGLVYLSLSHGSADANTLRVIRGRLQGSELTGVEEIFRARPTRDTPVHYGGRMLFLPDGTLLVTLGDGFDYREMAQQLDSHVGSILRLNPDGSVPGDNPFVGRDDALGEIFSYGHRNVQGIVYDAQADRIWQHEHGPRGGDELNILRAGENYGWPIVAHAVNYSGALVTPFTALPGVRNPVHIWQSAIAPAGLSQYRGELFPAWDGDLLVAGLVSRAIHRLSLDGDTITEEERLFRSLDRRMRDVRPGPDGAIYLLTDHEEGQVIRVLPD